MGFCLPSATHAEMTIDQMKSLGGSSQLQSTARRLLEKCGLPTSITHEAGIGDVRRSVSWRGVAMRLPAADWNISYGSPPRDTGREVGWLNAEPSRGGCLARAAWLVFNAKGAVGELEVRKKPDGWGFTTTYHVPANLYQAHKVIGVKVGLAKRIPVSTLIARYGPPDVILDAPGGRKRHRYWVLTRIDHRPESLHAVDFEIGNGDRSCGAYEISAAGYDFVNEKLDVLLREWERDYILD
jgi:hypothetical protein